MNDHSPTTTHHATRTAAFKRSNMSRSRYAVSRYANELSRCWVIANLLALGGVSAAFWERAPLYLLIGWSVFTALNALLHFLIRSGHLIGHAAAQNHAFNVGLAAVFGLSWGAGVAALLPIADPVQAGVLLAAAFGIATIAIPVFAESRSSYTFFAITLAVLATVGALSEDRFTMAAYWIIITSATLLILASVYYRAFESLRAIVHRLLRMNEIATSDSATHQYMDAELNSLADKKLSALNEAFAAYERNRRILRALGDAVITTDNAGNIDYVNPVAEVLLGWPHKELEQRSIEDCMRLVFPPEQRNHTREIFDQARLTRRGQSSNDNAQLIRRDGVVYGIDYIVTPIKDDRGEFSGAAFVLRDVTEKRHRAETIAWQATHDSLTGTINRTEFEIRLKKLVKRAHDDSRNVHSLLFIDIDNFKFVNDSYGHAAGDSALKVLADILRTRIRGADTLARVGGDEFTALLYSCSIEKARLIAEGLRAEVEKHEFTWQSIELPVSISVGIVEINKECKSAAEMIRAADSACYTAKKFGRNRVHLFDRDRAVNAKQARVFDFVKDIQTAIHGNRLELFYQPLCAMEDAQSSGQCELSVGIRNSEGDFIPRTELFDLARRYQLTEEIDRWVVKATIDALRLNHPTLCDMKLVLMPLSQQSLSDDRLLDYIVHNVEENKAYGDRLGFIIDEPGLTGHLDFVRYFVTSLKQYSYHFMVSDLGFGSESVDLIKSLQADFLGIRGSLVQNMLYNSVDYEVVLGLSRIARSLGIATVAENADTKSMRDALAKMGVDYAKGHINEEPRRVSIYSKAQWI